jgi:hypothetical protein
MSVYFRVIVLLFCINFPVYSAELAKDSLKDEEQTCSEMYEEIIKSDCGRIIHSWLDGAEIEIGLSLTRPNLAVSDLDAKKTFSGQTGGASLFPTVNLRFPNNYWGSSGMGYRFNFGYFYDFGFYQDIDRGSEIHRKDLNSYFYSLGVFVTPSILYDFGRSDEADDPYWASLGIGVGLGGGKIRGISYLTEDENDPVCYETVSEYIEGGLTSADVRDNCPLVSYEEIGLGISAEFSLEFRIKSWALGLNFNSVGIQNKNYTFTSFNLAMILSYLIPL